MSTERELIADIARRAGNRAPGLLQGIGDDCALWRPTAGTISVTTTDTLVAGVHFDLRWHPPRLLGRKAVTVNLSDIAAMGARPRFALLSLGLTGKEEPTWVEALLDGLAAALAEAQTVLIGGDTVSCPQGVMLSVTIIGEAQEEQILRRSGGRAGDSIWAGGPLGLAAGGLELCRRGLGDEPQWQEAVRAHLDPDAQVALGQELAASGLVHAMLDLSDGLATDLAHLCTASGVGAEVEAARLPIPALLQRAAAACNAGAGDNLPADPLAWAVSGGEDYRLLFTADPAHDLAITELGRRVPGADLHRIGRLTAESGVRLRTTDGRSREIGYGGYEHFRAGP